MRRIADALVSSVGRKAIMGLTGLLLVGFLIEHFLGNLLLIEDPSGEKFNEYVYWLQDFGVLLVVAEIGLVALFATHVLVAVRLTLENRMARKQGYVVRNNRGQATIGSISMFYSGALILGYLVKHLLDFRFKEGFLEDPAANVAAALSQPVHGVIYAVSAVLVGLHISHGFRSGLQSLGINHPAWNKAIRNLGWGLAIFFGLGFASIPVYFMFFWTEGSH